MKNANRFYRVFYHLARIALTAFRPLEVIGKENIPDGAAIVCSNHSHMVDPFFIAFAFGIDRNVHVIAKAELFRIPVVSQVLEKLKMIRVDRGVLDATTVKSTLGYLKNGEVVVIFPEGTRVSTDDAVTAKNGAVKIAERTAAPIVPLFLPRKKPYFKKVKLIIGEPYYIMKQSQKRSSDDYMSLSDTLMGIIKMLNPEHRTPEIIKKEWS